MKILQAFSVLALLFFASYAGADRPFPGSSPEGLNIAGDLQIAIPDLPPTVFTHDVDGKALGFEVKNPDGIGAFHFGSTCFLSNGSPVKFLAPAIPKDVTVLDTNIYVEYMGGTQLDPRLRPIKEDFCPEHAVVAMSLNDYLASHKIASRVAEEKKYLRAMLSQSNKDK